ncbi:MAG TPA: coenzyme F420-0:L-glutamate ligase [Ktedonobacterales bacterium]|jgi:coenzyme F420-0:L-glutamate ligase/coenzyme F420-1:gamma-L-glutamate ligase
MATKAESSEVRIIGLRGVPEIAPGADLAALVLGAAAASDLALADGDIVIATHKAVSKAEGRLLDLRTVEPSALAREFAAAWDRDPRQVEVVLRESRRVVRMDRGLIIAETRHGLVCANAGVDQSNVAGDDMVCLLPEDPDASAARLRAGLRERGGRDVAVIVSDSFGRPWRQGIVNIAIGAAGLAPLLDYRGQPDNNGRVMSATVMAVADELASAAELMTGKLDRCPFVVIRGYAYDGREGSAREIILERERDLFR